VNLEQHNSGEPWTK